MKALLFDLDGTLIESIPLWIEANLHALRERNFIMDEEAFLKHIYHQGLHYSGMLEACGLNTDRADQFYYDRNTYYQALLRQNIEWIGNAESALQQCTNTVRIGIMTGSARSFVDAIDSKLHLSEICQTIVTYDDTGLRMKPDPYGLLLLAETLGIDPADCIYVGDQDVDIKAAKAARMTSCLIPNRSTPEGAREEADIVLQDIGEIVSLVGGL